MSARKAKKNHADRDRTLSTPSASHEEEAMAKDLTKYVTTDQAAELMGVLPTSINHLIHDGRLKAIKLGRDWMVFVPSIEKYRETKSKRGRPSSRVPQAQEIG